MGLLNSLRLIRKHFLKNEYNYKNTNIMSETKEQIKQFQWKKGEKFGNIETVKSETSKFYYFESGGQIFKNVVSEFMEPIIDGTIPLPPVGNIVKKSVNQEIQQVTVETTAKIPEKSAIEELVERLSKKNIEKFETTLNLNIPNKTIFTMLIENSDENPEELIKVIAKVAVSQIEINKLQEYLTEEITNFINKYYNE